MENITEEISDINMKENKNDIKLLQNKTKSEHKNNKNKNKKKKCEENIIKEKKKEVNSSDTYDREKSKYKLTIKPEYIKIKEENGIKKPEIDCSLCSDDYKLNELYNWIHLILEEFEFYYKKGEKSNFELIKENIKPLLTLLEEKNLDKIILDKLFTIMVLNEYRYIKNKNNVISFENVVWPSGISTVGANKNLIDPEKIAYLLNNKESKFRNYMQSIRKILLFLQKKYEGNNTTNK